MAGKIADRLNNVIAANQTLGTELSRVSRLVGKEGKLSQRLELRGSDQVWSESAQSVNSLIEDLVYPTSEMQRVVGAVADGDLSKKITGDVHGEMLDIKTKEKIKGGDYVFHKPGEEHGPFRCLKACLILEFRYYK